MYNNIYSIFESLWISPFYLLSFPCDSTLITIFFSCNNQMISHLIFFKFHFVIVFIASESLLPVVISHILILPTGEPYQKIPSFLPTLSINQSSHNARTVSGSTRLIHYQTVIFTRTIWGKKEFVCLEINSICSLLLFPLLSIYFIFSLFPLFFINCKKSLGKIETLETNRNIELDNSNT